MKKLAKTFALVLCISMLLGMMTVLASAANTVVEVKTADELCAAVDALVANPIPTTIKLTADMTPAYADYKDNRNSVIGILPEDDASVLDLNGHTITFSNVKFQGRIIDSVGGGKVCYVAGNKTRLGEACSFPLEFGFEDLVSEIRISNKNATETHDTIRRFPANTRIYANSTIELFFDLLTIGSGCTVEPSVTVSATNGIYLEAATAEDLSLTRLATAGVTRIILTDDITDENLSVFVPADAVLDFNGHKLTCKGITGTTVDSVAEAAAQAAAEAAAEPAAPAAPATPAAPAVSATKYTVKDGDCLYAIARKYLGGGMFWPTLYEANKAVIGSNPRLIYTGTVLTIPADNTYIPAEELAAQTEPAAPATPATPAAPAELNPVQTISVGQFHSAEQGSEVTYTVSGVTGAKVEARIPAGTEYVSCTGDGKFADGKITWDAAKGDVTFTVKVTGEISSTILSDGVTANGKAVNKIATGVRGKDLTLISKQLLAAIPVGEGSESSNNTPGIVALALEKGANVKTNITITSANLLRAVFVTEDTNYEKDGALGKHLDKAPSADTAHIYNMLVPGYYCGRQIEGTGDETQVKTFDLADLEIGDILVAGEMNLGYVKDGSSSNKAYATLIKLSDNKVIIGYRYSRTELKTGWKVVEMDAAAQAEIQDWMSWQYFFLLRPTQAYADITKN